MTGFHVAIEEPSLILLATPMFFSYYGQNVHRKTTVTKTCTEWDTLQFKKNNNFCGFLVDRSPYWPEYEMTTLFGAPRQDLL